VQVEVKGDHVMVDDGFYFWSLLFNNIYI